MKGIFTTRPDTHYDDDVVRRYHFPNRYLDEAHKCIGDWIVYYEPGRRPDSGGARGLKSYLAVARVTHIEADPQDTKSSYAFVTDYLPFDSPVRLHRGGKYWESPLNALDNTAFVGAKLRGNSIRTLSNADFAAIVLAGLTRTLDVRDSAEHDPHDALDDERIRALLEAAPETQARSIVDMLTRRPLRDRAFRARVVGAYRQRCAVTGLRLINGGGRPEVQAAHIVPVKDNGADIVQNGIALSATCHWLFDRHLISLTDDYGLLVSHNRVPAEFRSLFTGQIERIHLPYDKRLWPDRKCMAHHRQRFAEAPP